MLHRAQRCRCPRYGSAPFGVSILHEDFVADIERLLAERTCYRSARLELRVAEEAFVAPRPLRVPPLRQLSIQLSSQTSGSQPGSLDALARAPIWGVAAGSRLREGRTQR